jgi:hypothetical protein
MAIRSHGALNDSINNSGRVNFAAGLKEKYRILAQTADAKTTVAGAAKSRAASEAGLVDGRNNANNAAAGFNTAQSQEVASNAESARQVDRANIEAKRVETLRSQDLRKSGTNQFATDLGLSFAKNGGKDLKGGLSYTDPLNFESYLLNPVT